MIVEVDAPRVVADLKRLRELTSDACGAQRVAWTEVWASARRFYGELLGEIGLKPEMDEAGNLWTYAPAGAKRYLAIGSHLDSVPDGGWLDGALGVMAGIGVARALGSQYEEGTGLALVDFADEEGVRFGRSLFGSSAVSGSLDTTGLGDLADRDGCSLGEVVGEHGIEVSMLGRARGRVSNLTGYLELHIEQGPVLESEAADIGIVDGVVGIERFDVTVAGCAGHAGSTPMRHRRDPLAAVASSLAEVEQLARSLGGLATTGVLEAEPGVVTIVPGRIRFTLDLRHADEAALERLADGSRRAVDAACAERRCHSEWRSVWSVAPTEFAPDLRSLASEAAEPHGRSITLVSGPGHDAVEMARRVPTAMMFAPSRGGLSHVRGEDTDERQLLTAIEAFGAWAGLAIDRD